MARRLLERGVRFVQIFHRGWDQHANLPRDLRDQCRDVDRACYGLVQDLKRRGLLEDTMVIWGGEFGRTVYCQGALKRDNYGRDHHPRAFTIWATGGGIRPGMIHGETDDYSYNITRDPVHIRDLHATILHQFGIKHDSLTFKFQGLDQKLTGVDPARVVKEILA
jgi:arylsulfatase A-like enzyme